MVLPNRSKEAPAADWEDSYTSGQIPWRSAGLGEISRRFLTYAEPRSDLLEVGCGLGDDAADLVKLGFNYHGIDLSRAAIAQAAIRLKRTDVNLTAADVLTWAPHAVYGVVYEKGVFHGMDGRGRRRSLARRIAALLQDGGIWITVCGAADGYDRSLPRGAIYLTHLAEAVEREFEILQIKKGPYGVRKPGHDFSAWYGLFRRRGDL